MSKVDAMRAIRDARFAEAAKKPATPARQRVATPAAAPIPAAAPAASPAPATETADGLCGHRNMGGKSCTREADHQKTGTKSHRYG